MTIQQDEEPLVDEVDEELEAQPEPQLEQTPCDEDFEFDPSLPVELEREE